MLFYEQEEEEPELTEEEEAIKANLESQDPLPPELLDSILTSWWTKEPFKYVLLKRYVIVLF